MRYTCAASKQNKRDLLTLFLLMSFPVQHQGGQGWRGKAQGGAAVCGARPWNSVHRQQVSAGQRRCNGQ